MNANVNTPDLVRRAAVKLAQEQGVQSERPASVVEKAAAFEQRPKPNVAPRSAQTIASRSVTISPTIFAANGFQFLSHDRSKDLIFEEYRSIRRKILANASGSVATNPSSNRSILVTSATPGDGKTFTSINLALALAAHGEHRVLLMDADSHRRSVLKYMGIKAEAGWIDLLTRNDLTLSDVVLNTNIPNLSILPSGQASDQASEMVGSQKMTDLLAELSLLGPDIITVIDSVPCLVSNEPAILAELVGQVLFVVAANETGREDVETALRHLAGASSINLILNKAEPFMAEQFSKYHYYNYRQEQK